MKRSDTSPFRTTGTGGSYFLKGGGFWIKKVRPGKWRLVERQEGGWLIHHECATLTEAVSHFRDTFENNMQ